MTVDPRLMQEALENIAHAVIPSYPQMAYDREPPVPVVKLIFVEALRKIARDAIGWQPDYLDTVMTQEK